MHRPRSIRARLLIGILVPLAAILFSTAWWSYEVAKHESEELFGARLATSARVLEAIVARQVERATLARPLVIELPDALAHATDDAGTALGHPYEAKIAFQIWRDDGTLLVRSASAGERPFGGHVPGFSTQTVDGQLYHVFVLRSGDTWIQVAENHEVRAELIDDLGLAVMTPLIVGAILLLVIVNLLVQYALRPLRQLAAHIEQRKPESLKPMALVDVPQEVAPVVSALNDLLTRVERAFERERRFTDAAAHELRTPIAALKLHAENLMNASTEGERRQSLARLDEGLTRTAKLASQMLTYSRTQNMSDAEAPRMIDLKHVVADAGASLEPLRRARSQEIRAAVSGAVGIVGEHTNVQRLVVNLLDNALRYAPDRSTIDVSVRSTRDHVVLTITNPGEAIPAELRERVFEPYYRVPGSGSEGSGLGLAIVKEIAAQHGATVEMTALAGKAGTAVTVSFPRATALGGHELAAADAARPGT